MENEREKASLDKANGSYDPPQGRSEHTGALAAIEAIVDTMFTIATMGISSPPTLEERQRDYDDAWNRASTTRSPR